MKKQKTNLQATSLKGFLAVLLILTFAGFAAAQTNSNKVSNEVNLSFKNQTNYPAAIYWVKAGKEKLYKTLNAADSFLQPTFANQQWRVRLNGKLIGTYAATAAPQQEIEIIVSKSESPMTIRNQKDAEKHCKPFTPNSTAVWIGKWGSLGESQLSFCEFAQLHFSEQEAAPKGASLVFENQTELPFQLYKVNENGTETLSGQIPAGSYFTQLTFAAQKWKLKLTDGRTIGEYVAADHDSQNVVIAYDMGEVQQIRNQKEAEQECNKLAASKGLVWTGSWSELGDANAPFCQLIRLRTVTQSK